MIPFEEMKSRLAGIQKSRRWLADQIGYKENTVRQYLAPKTKPSDDFLTAASDAIEAEELRQRAGKPESPPWSMIFLTEDEFERADRASRLVGAESLKAFCREAILAKADDILAKKKRAPYGKLNVFPATKVAEDKDGLRSGACSHGLRQPAAALLPPCCHSLRWSQAWTRQQADEPKAAAGCRSPWGVVLYCTGAINRAARQASRKPKDFFVNSSTFTAAA